MKVVNPNKVREKVDSYLQKTFKQQVEMFPQFFCGIKFEKFRHIKNLKLEIKHPITVISGTNKSGKTTVLLSIACSHYNFKRRNVCNGNLERNTWSNLMKFVAQDEQKEDWTYFVDYREGDKETKEKRGQRKAKTKKWNGVAKKDGQIGRPADDSRNNGRSVCLIDMERIVPARHLSDYVYKITKEKRTKPENDLVNEYLSYVFERNYKVNQISSFADRNLYAFRTSFSYSSYNTASGEDALTRILQDVVDAPKNALILVEEIEIGLHPKIQRRLMDVLYHEAATNRKQFIITTHSPTILSSVKPESRIFIKNEGDSYKVIPEISINEALTRMDSENYPLLNMYVEDDLSEKILKKALKSLEKEQKGISKLVKIVVSGSAEHLYPFFQMRKKIYDKEKINAGYACVLDGDKRKQYKAEDLLFFHYSNLSPEEMLVKEYLNVHPNEGMEFHLTSSDNHYLFKAMVEEDLVDSEDEAFEECWNCLMETDGGKKYFEELQKFILEACKKFSKEL